MTFSPLHLYSAKRAHFLYRFDTTAFEIVKIHGLLLFQLWLQPPDIGKGLIELFLIRTAAAQLEHDVSCLVNSFCCNLQQL